MESTKKRRILRIFKEACEVEADILAVEEPLEIKLGFGPRSRREYQSLAVTMRTPGDDHDLVRGFLFTEGLIGRETDIEEVRSAGEDLHPEAAGNVVLVELSPDTRIDMDAVSRHFYTTSSCGICGKASLEMVRSNSIYPLRPGRPKILPEKLFALPKQLINRQKLFVHTGGIHAAGLFTSAGELILLREDVGRHNAVDKVIGAAMQRMMLPLYDCLLLVSGRAGFELVQKAIMAGIPLLAAVGAASSLAVELADEEGMTLVGFLREGQANCYCGTERIIGTLPV